jgi:hypothetical protein
MQVSVLEAQFVGLQDLTPEPGPGLASIALAPPLAKISGKVGLDGFNCARGIFGSVSRVRKRAKVKT